MSDATTIAADASVVDFAFFQNGMRGIEALRNAGMIKDDATQAQLLLAKRLNHALNADYETSKLSKPAKDGIKRLQAAFKASTVPYETLVQSGAMNQMFETYLGILVADANQKLKHLETEVLSGEEANPKHFNEMKDAAIAKRDKYLMEQDYYKNNADAVKQAATRFKAVVNSGEYLSTTEIAGRSGVICDDPAKACDMADDVVGVVKARDIKRLAGLFADDVTLALYASDPAANETRIKALAMKIAAATSPLEGLREVDAESEQLSRILALHALASTQLHEAMSQERMPAALIEVERKANDTMQRVAQVALSLAYDYLGEGAGSNDARIVTIKNNLKAEMEKASIAILPLDEAKKKAAEISRDAAEDLLRAVNGKEEYAARITALAKSAGVDVDAQPLAPRAQLIGIDVMDAIAPVLADSHTIITHRALKALEEKLAGMEKGAKGVAA